MQIGEFQELIRERYENRDRQRGCGSTHILYALLFRVHYCGRYLYVGAVPG